MENPINLSAHSPVLTAPQLNDQIRAVFGSAMHDLKVDFENLENDRASQETLEKYQRLASDNADIVQAEYRKPSTLHFITALTVEYIKSLIARKRLPEKLAFDLSQTNSKVLVWAVVKDDDEETMNAMILAEAAANAKYFDYGFSISSTIVEESDNLSVPPHYHSMID
jgi:hypothetical protein